MASKSWASLASSVVTTDGDDHVWSSAASIADTTDGLTSPASCLSLYSKNFDEPEPEPESVELFAPRSFYDSNLLPPVPRIEPTIPLAVDGPTPDNWVNRDERLVRLTGKHPFNVEAPLSTLFSKGFLTPQNLFYVRNHGYVPRVTRDEAKSWKLRVHGLVENEFQFTIDDLKSMFPTVTLPVTLVCAGNRRKEQNVVTKGLGFNWGAAGVSTGLFTGVYLADIIDYCRPKNPLLTAYPSYETVVPGRARHVIFEGADELPKGKYGTSQRLSWAMDRQKGMLIAWAINGEDLSPDHGYPLRLVVPGQIGGRMVKWLQRIEISDRESQHHLHFFDNKLLPTVVSADQARNEDKWWYDPKYIINDLNVNAAICSPDHNQIVTLQPNSSQRLPIEGYAYTGGGRRITRVEVTLDDGKTWRLADITYPEDLYRLYPVQNHPFFGTLDLSMTEMSFCWCFWRLDLNIMSDLVGPDVRVIAVRAMDEALQTMPRDMYWSPTSMMNSWWFRVAVHKDEKGESVRFEHPAPVAGDAGGWMQRMKDAGADPRFPNFGGESPYSASASNTAASQPDASSAKEDILKEMLDDSKTSVAITPEELAQHADSEGPEPWFVVHGHVYDGTKFLEGHPGGEQSIRIVAGEDATEDFMAIHSVDAKRMLRDYHLGKLQGSISTEASADAAEDEDSSKPFLQPKRWKKTYLTSKRVVSHDSRIFRFALSHEDQLVGLPVGQHVYVRVKRTNPTTKEVETIQRAYTPYSSNSQKGYLDILIKVYFPGAPPNSKDGDYPGGKMTMLLENAPIGAESEELTIELKGPVGEFTYLGNKQVQWNPGNRCRSIKKLVMICGGSGITPIWTTLKAIADEFQALPADETHEPIQIWLISGNRTEEDILLREELEEIASLLKQHIRVWYVLSSNNLGDDWKMGRGYVDENCLRQHLPPPPPTPTGDELEDTLALVCGPPPMEKCVSAGLKSLGWDIDRTVVFF
ncbi:unnamed protein product [Clonostachys rhizophaga]|uniref:Nitrate reductase [NADPH] n=1 Tax=Clonostachys rhizophaga TaxID=160324 RepID=A0A9N9YH12_9HYPO|nr:unnamed protein product [Clonostachys rhizophaga]